MFDTSMRNHVESYLSGRESLADRINKILEFIEVFNNDYPDGIGIKVIMDYFNYSLIDALSATNSLCEQYKIKKLDTRPPSYKL
jgi:hypothetical protein